MKVVEFRMPLPMTLEQYHVCQLYMVAKSSLEDTTANPEDGVECLVSEPYDDPVKGRGQYTHKRVSIAGKLPAWLFAFVKRDWLTFDEKSHNGFPILETKYECAFLPKLRLTIKSNHIPGLPTSENALNLPSNLLVQREVVYIDIANDPISAADYKAAEDVACFESKKAGIGPLGKDWMKTTTPLMTCYKVVLIDAPFGWGVTGRVESWLASAMQNLFFLYHRKAVCWMDQWYDLTMEDIRILEAETARQLDELWKRKRGEALSTSERDIDTAIKLESSKESLAVKSDSIMPADGAVHQASESPLQLDATPRAQVSSNATPRASPSTIARKRRRRPSMQWAQIDVCQPIDFTQLLHSRPISFSDATDQSFTLSEDDWSVPDESNSPEALVMRSHPSFCGSTPAPLISSKTGDRLSAMASKNTLPSVSGRQKSDVVIVDKLNRQASLRKRDTGFQRTGFLYKLGDGYLNTTWNSRYIVLSGSELQYFDMPQDPQPKRAVSLINASVVWSGEMRDRGHSFVIAPADGQKHIYLSGETEGESKQWMLWLQLSSVGGDISLTLTPDELCRLQPTVPFLSSRRLNMSEAQQISTSAQRDGSYSLLQYPAQQGTRGGSLSSALLASTPTPPPVPSASRQLGKEAHQLTVRSAEQLLPRTSRRSFPIHNDGPPGRTLNQLSPTSRQLSATGAVDQASASRLDPSLLPSGDRSGAPSNCSGFSTGRRRKQLTAPPESSVTFPMAILKEMQEAGMLQSNASESQAGKDGVKHERDEGAPASPRGTDREIFSLLPNEGSARIWVADWANWVASGRWGQERHEGKLRRRSGERLSCRMETEWGDAFSFIRAMLVVIFSTFSDLSPAIGDKLRQGISWWHSIFRLYARAVVPAFVLSSAVMLIALILTFYPALLRPLFLATTLTYNVGSTLISFAVVSSFVIAIGSTALLQNGGFFLRLKCSIDNSSEGTGSRERSLSSQMRPRGVLNDYRPAPRSPTEVQYVGKGEVYVNCDVSQAFRYLMNPQLLPEWRAGCTQSLFPASEHKQATAKSYHCDRITEHCVLSSMLKCAGSTSPSLPLCPLDLFLGQVAHPNASLWLAAMWMVYGDLLKSTWRCCYERVWGIDRNGSVVIIWHSSDQPAADAAAHERPNAPDLKGSVNKGASLGSFELLLHSFQRLSLEIQAGQCNRPRPISAELPAISYGGFRCFIIRPSLNKASCSISCLRGLDMGDHLPSWVTESCLLQELKDLGTLKTALEVFAAGQRESDKDTSSAMSDLCGRKVFLSSSGGSGRRLPVGKDELSMEGSGLLLETYGVSQTGSDSASASFFGEEAEEGVDQSS